MLSGKIIRVKASAVAEFTSTVILVALLACATSFGQSAARVTKRQIHPGRNQVLQRFSRSRSRSNI
jgi:hypothetical protein